jgi:phosphoribosylanthranilate isomerase
MTKVKICGITNLEDAQLSVKFGADALGFNFYKKSPRFIEAEKVREIVEKLPRKVLKVGVFVNESLENVAKIAETAKLDAIQLHGEETPEFCRQVKEKTNLEIIKAFRVSPDFTPEDVLKYDVDAILLDAYNPKEHGGTGETFDWEIAKKVQELFPKMYLAGGLKHENISRLIDRIKPFYIDVCSGIESEKGKKDKVKLINFLKLAKYDYQKEIENIYDFCWAKHPSLTGFRIQIKSLSSLVESINCFNAGLVYASQRSNFDLEPFLLEFYKSRIDSISGVVDETLPENHLSFQQFVIKHFGENRRYSDWHQKILEQTQDNELEALYTFFALLEEFKLEKEAVD